MGAAVNREVSVDEVTIAVYLERSLGTTAINSGHSHSVLITLVAMYFDAHCHLDFSDFEVDRKDVFERARSVGVTGFVVAGVRPENWDDQRQLAQTWPGVLWTAGIHPVVAASMTHAELKDALSALPAEWRGTDIPCGIGETGLDSQFAPKHTLPQQIESFRAHLAMARENCRPVVLHVVGSHGATLDILRKDGVGEGGGMVHSFGGHRNVAMDYVRLGMHISFSLSVCRSNAQKTQAAAASIPLERLLIETDSPEQSQQRGQRNEPSCLIEVARTIGKLRGCDTETILRVSARNCAQLFANKR